MVRLVVPVVMDRRPASLLKVGLGLKKRLKTFGNVLWLEKRFRPAWLGLDWDLNTSSEVDWRMDFRFPVGHVVSEVVVVVAGGWLAGRAGTSVDAP